jgi:hypothetical protein
MKLSKKNLFLTLLSVCFVLSSCEKNDDDGNSDDNGPAVNCASKNIIVNTTVKNASPCQNNGEVLITASGSSGFTYQINGGNFTSNSEVKDLAAGNYTLVVKDADGCTKNTTFIITESGTAGPLFTNVKALVSQKCAISGCHASNGAVPNIFNTDCKIVERGQMMKTKAVDGYMGGLTEDEKKVITDWLGNGGRFID